LNDQTESALSSFHLKSPHKKSSRGWPSAICERAEFWVHTNNIFFLSIIDLRSFYNATFITEIARLNCFKQPR